MLTSEEKKQYNRHLILDKIGEAGQLKLKQAKVLVIGAGGLGCPVLSYLAAAGIGLIGIVDSDKVEISNLQRQVLFDSQQIGVFKAKAAEEKMHTLNQTIRIQTYCTKLTSKNALEILKEYDIIVDCTDNFASRYLINDACVLLDKVTVYASVFRFEGQLSVFNYLDKIDKKAQKVGAVNTIRISKKGKLKGFNTDVYGFKKSLKPLLKKHHKKALILGTGGASKAVAYVLKKLKIKYKFVSRNPKGKKIISYQDLTKNIIESHHLIINCTPLGTYPNINNYPDIPYQFISKKHLLFDLIYNPSETTFLKKGKEKGAVIKNGLEMLEQQAEKAWRIWNKK